MTWSDYRHREHLVDAVAEVADARRDGLLPWDEVAGAAEAFGSPEALLRSLQMRWATRLAGAVDAVLATEPLDPEAGVVHAWRRTAASMPGVRAVLDANVDHPAIRAGRTKEHRMLAAATGQTTWSRPEDAVRAGRRIEERARAVTVVTGSRGAA